MTKKTPWSTAEIEYLRQNYGHMRVADMAAKIGRTVPAVRMKACDLGITRRLKGLRMPESFTQGLKRDDHVTVIDNIQKQGGYGGRVLKGKVVYLHKRYIVIQLPHYRESFLVADIITGRVNIERRHAA